MDKTDTVELSHHPPSSLNSSSLAEDDLNPAAAAGGRQEVTSSFALRYTLHIPNSLFEVAKSCILRPRLAKKCNKRRASSTHELSKTHVKRWITNVIKKFGIGLWGSFVSQNSATYRCAARCNQVKEKLQYPCKSQWSSPSPRHDARWLHHYFCWFLQDILISHSISASLESIHYWTAATRPNKADRRGNNQQLCVRGGKRRNEVPTSRGWKNFLPKTKVGNVKLRIQHASSAQTKGYVTCYIHRCLLMCPILMTIEHEWFDRLLLHLCFQKPITNMKRRRVHVP